MFPTRVPGFGNTTNLNRKRLPRRSTSPVVGRRRRPSLEALETRQLLSTYVVTNTGDNGGIDPNVGAGTGTLRQAIVDSNASTQPTSDIVFAIPASTVPNLDVPVPGFNPATQDWTITLSSPLPTIKRPVTIDGYSQGEFPIPFVYPQGGGAIQTLEITGNPTGGSFTLTTSTPLPVGTTAPIPYNATSNQVGAALQDIVGAGNVIVSGGVVANTILITFGGIFTGESISRLIVTSNLTGGTNPSVVILSTPVEITSTPNTVTAIDGNNAEARVIIDGSQINTTAFPDPAGFMLEALHSTLSGLVIDGFGVGVSVPNPSYVGDLIQGNFIGKYLEYPVDPNTGAPLPSPDNVELVGIGNTQGVVLNSNNTTVGGTHPQEDNVISGNVQQGVLIQPSATGNLVEGNQIGIVGPSSNGRYFQAGNGAEGILDYGSSNQIGGPVPAAGNLISANLSHGIRISGPVATRTIVAANIIGLGPGGGYAFGTGNPGNGDYGDGVLIEGASDNQIGGPTASWGNTISSNFGSGVFITDLGSGASVARSIGNTVLNNMIGVTADGTAAKGNALDGVDVVSPTPLQPNELSSLTSQTVIGPGNVISGNLQGVSISGPGPGAKGVVVRDNLIGTDITGTLDLGNAEAGVLIENATDAVIEGDANGSQVISGNNQGVVISGATSTRNLVEGNLIGTDKTGLYAIPNAQEGVAILGAFGNTIGGTTAAALNLISGNHWGVWLGSLDGTTATPTATANLVEGNLIGTDITGKAPLGNEVNGVIVRDNASDNTIGGTVPGAGNTIAFNVLTGVRVESGTGDSILSNSIYSNGQLGIILVPPSANDLQAAPVLTTAGGGASSTVLGTLNSLSNTSFLIQFFSNLVPDPSGYGQGQTSIGSVTVTTDASGYTPIAFTPSNGLSASTWVTATATNISTGDTSEFSNAVSPVNVQFLTSTYSVDATAGLAQIEVVRVGDPNTQVTEHYATSNGTAVAGKDYTAASGILTFQPDVTEQTFQVPILPNPAQTASSVTVNLALIQQPGDAPLGSISNATLTINNNLPPIVQFSSSTYTAYSTYNVASVTVTRTGGSPGTTVQVSYATAGGTAVPGVDYTPVAGTLTFLANQTTAAFTVPILRGSAATVSKTVGLVLSGPTGGGKLGSISTATLTILPPPPVPPPSPPLQITGEQLVLGPAGITAVVFSFSKPLNPSRVPDLGNYGYYVDVAGANGVFRTSGDRYIPLSAAIYNPATSTVTVIPSTPLPLNRLERITINGLANPLLGRGLIDTSGNLLSGQSGVPGSPFIATFGDVQSVSLVGAVPRKSALTFQANSAGGRTTYVPRIQGAAGVRFRDRTPASVFRSTPLPLVVKTPRVKTAAVKRRK
ncbi:MAG: Calx-beta domain-containing protein [Isosphaeraceae bacterium]